MHAGEGIKDRNMVVELRGIKIGRRLETVPLLTSPKIIIESNFYLKLFQ